MGREKWDGRNGTGGVSGRGGEKGRDMPTALDADDVLDEPKCNTTQNHMIARSEFEAHGEIMHIKEPLLLIRKSNPCGGSGFPLSLSEWSFTICPTTYNRKQNVLSASLNKTFPSFLLLFFIFQIRYYGRQWDFI